MRLAFWWDSLINSLKREWGASHGRESGGMEAHSNQSSMNGHGSCILIPVNLPLIQGGIFLKCKEEGLGKVWYFCLMIWALKIFPYHLWNLIWIELQCEDSLILNPWGKGWQQEMKRRCWPSIMEGPFHSTCPLDLHQNPLGKSL